MPEERMKQTEIGEIPESWELGTIDELAKIYNTLRHPLNAATRANMRGKYPYCGANGIVDYIDNYKFDGEFVLIAEDGGAWGQYENSAYIMESKFWVNNHAHVIQAKVETSDNYFICYMLNFLNIKSFITGDARGKLSKSILLKLKLFLPPLPEQKKIAAVLSEIQKNIDAKEELIKVTTELKKSTMRYLFTYGTKGEKTKQTEIGEIPESWELGTIDELAKIYNTLRHPLNAATRANMRGKYPYCGANGIVDYIDNYKFDGEFVLIAEDGGAWGQYENSAYIMESKFWVNNHAHVIQAKVETSDNYFICYMLNFLNIKSFITGDARGKLSKSILLKLKLFLPPLPEQKKIASILSKIDERIQSYEEQKLALQALFKSMLHKLMTAQIRVHKLDIDVSEVE